MKKVAFMFPGQGSQAIGMGKDIHDANSDIQALYVQANELLNIDITNLMFNGPEEQLKETANAQPALLLSSIAIYSLLHKEGITPAVTIGHSLGEYSALVASGAIALEEALPLVQKRGQLMEEAYPAGKGSMAAVLGLDEDKIREALANLSEGEIVNLANFNCPGQIVVSGTKKGIEEAITLLKDAGARRVQELVVSGPFHSELMQPASEKFSDHLANVSVQTPDVPVYMNVTASPAKDAAEIKDLLVKQLYSPVRFSESIEKIIESGIDAFVEVGNGKVLCGLLRKIDKSIPTFAVQDPESLEAFLTWYKEEN